MIYRNLNHLATFAALAETGSFAGAARRLRLPTSTVSEHVAALEKNLGVQTGDPHHALQPTDRGGANPCARWLRGWWRARPKRLREWRRWWTGPPAPCA